MDNKSLKDWRILKAYSRRDLAEKAGVSPTTIASIETGHSATLRTKRKLASALSVEPSAIQW